MIQLPEIDSILISQAVCVSRIQLSHQLGANNSSLIAKMSALNVRVAGELQLMDALLIHSALLVMPISPKSAFHAIPITF